MLQKTFGTILQGVKDVGPATAAHAPLRTSWGFVLDLPSISELEADAASTAARRAGSLPRQPPAESAPDQPLFLEHLGASRLFHCPDAVDAMAEAYGISDAFGGLQASWLLIQNSRYPEI